MSSKLVQDGLGFSPPGSPAKGISSLSRHESWNSQHRILKQPSHLYLSLPWSVKPEETHPKVSSTAYASMLQA